MMVLLFLLFAALAYWALKLQPSAALLRALYSQHNPVSRYCSTGSYAIVTGASTGIGLELAKQLVDIGFNLLITGFEEADSGNALVLLQTRARRDQTIKVFTGDLSQSQPRQDLLKAVDALLNSHDVRLVISNAGTSTPLPYSLLETPTELAECIVNVNLTSSVLLAQTVLNHWHQQPADTQDKALVFVSSMAGLTPAPYCSVYGATKAALVSLAASLTLETPSHVHVQACCPGMVQAGNTQRWFGSARCQVMDVATPAQAAKNILLGLGCDQWRTTTSGIHVGYMFLMQMLPAWLSGRIVRHEHEKARLRLGMTT